MAVALLRDCPEAALACHLNPDADALGSMLGLAQVLHRRGCRVGASFREPLDLPAPLAGLPRGGALGRPAPVAAGPVPVGSGAIPSPAMPPASPAT